MRAILPLQGLWRAGVLRRPAYTALRGASIAELPELTLWTRADLAALTGLDADSLNHVEAVLSRYCLGLAGERRRRFRRPGKRLDPY